MKALIVAGEASGDIYGGALATVLPERIPDLNLYGMGGDRMADAGVHLLYHHRHVAVVGVIEVFSKLRRLREAYSTLVRWVQENSPDFAILIDFPDFNFRLARMLKKQGVKIFYFISPQIWAWRKNRIHFLKEHVDLMISILPFEKRLYDRENLRTEYVGHPLVEIVRKDFSTQPPFPRNDRPLVGLMPGSREIEVRRHLPVLMETAAKLQKQLEIDLLIVRAPGLPAPEITIPAHIRQVTADRYAAMAACDFLYVASGTSTLEAAILNVPFVIVYKVGTFSWQLGKYLVRVPYYGLVNWIAEKKVVPEFIQDNMNSDALAKEAVFYLTNPEARRDMQSALQQIVERLGPPGAIERAANAVVSSL